MWIRRKRHRKVSFFCLKNFFKNENLQRVWNFARYLTAFSYHSHHFEHYPATWLSTPFFDHQQHNLRILLRRALCRALRRSLRWWQPDNNLALSPLALTLNNVIKYVYFYVVVNLPFRPWRKPNSALRAKPFSALGCLLPCLALNYV